MNKLLYIALLIAFFVPFFAGSRGGLGILPGPSVLLFELVSGIIFLAALIYCAYHKSLSVSPKYLILFMFVCLHFVVGAIANSIDPAVAFAGIRSYLKYMPLFLLPLVYPFSDKEMTGQFKFLIVLSLLQLPLVAHQFFILDYKDLVGGTFGIGSFMSIYMVCTILILTAFYFRERISIKTFLILAFLLFIPTTLNESKGTFVLLVVGFLSITLGANLKRSQLIMATSTLVIMLMSFVVVYNMYFDAVGGAEGLTSFVTTDSEKGITRYLYSGESTEIDPDTVLEDRSSIPGALPSFAADEFKTRRIDEIVLPLRALSNDPTRLLLGVGIGNASKSKKNLFAGQYSFLEQHQIFGHALSRFLWETGILGTFLYLICFGFFYWDARHLARTAGLSGALALGWAGVVMVVIVSLLYKNIFVSDALGALFWYFSGYIAAKSYALKMTSSTQIYEGKLIMSQSSTTHPVNRQSILDKIQ